MSLRAAPNRRPPGIIIDKKLTLKQIKFCEAYLTNGRSARGAAITAGYKATNVSARANYMLDMPHIYNYIKERMEKENKKIESTFDWKLKKLKSVTEKFIPDEVDQIGNGVGHGLSAITEMNKMEGHYAAEKHVNVNLDCDVDLKKVEATVKKLQLKHNGEY